MDNAVRSGSPSLASLLLGSQDGVAVAFNDNYWYSTTGYYGSMRVNDSATPANNYDSSPRTSSSATKIANSGSSLKVVRESDGYLDFAPHNLALRSDDVSNASWSKFNTCTNTGTNQLNFPATGDRVQQFPTASNCIGRTGIFSAVLSGTGTMSLAIYENGATTYQQVTLTGTPTRYSVSRNIADTATDVRLFIERRSATSDTATAVTITDIQFEVSYHRTTPSTYIKTTSAAVYGPPFEWDASGALIGILREDARTNLCLRNCDLTNAAWTAANMNTARTATGPNNRANFATTLTATAGNATILQSITSASANRRTGCWIKRRTGSGNIDLTQDNGATWTTVTVTNEWTLVQTANATVTNPVIGLRIVTNGDAVDVCFFQHETSATVNEITSPIYTVATAITRAVDNFTSITSELVTLSGSATIYAHFKPLSINALQSGALIFGIGVSPGTANLIVVARRAGLNNLRGAVTASPNSMLIEGGAGTLAGDKLAVAVTLNDGEFVADGASIGTDITVNFPTTTTTDYAGGSLTSGGVCAAGHLVACMIRPVRMSQADMITLTA